MNIKKTIKDLNIFFLKHLKLIVISFSFIIIIVIGFFLYFNFYQTIISAKQIIVLQTDIAPATVNVKLLNEVEQRYENKLKTNNIYNWEKFSNIFSLNINNIINSAPSLNIINPKTSF